MAVATERRAGKPGEFCDRCNANLQGMYAFDVKEDTKEIAAGSTICESCELRMQYMAKPPREPRAKRERKPRAWKSSMLLRKVRKIWPREDHLCITLLKRNDVALVEVEIRDPDPDPYGNASDRIMHELQLFSGLRCTLLGEGKVERCFPRFSYSWVKVRLEPPEGGSTAE